MSEIDEPILTATIAPIETAVPTATVTTSVQPVQPADPVDPAPAAPAQPVHVDGRNVRTDDDAVLHSFVDVVAGEHQGRRGSFDRVLERTEDGWPKRALVRTRDEFNELLAVPYEHLRSVGIHGRSGSGSYLGGR